MNPYIPFQLCEIAVLKSVSNWSNTRVRIFGKVGKRICVTHKTDLELKYFHSIGEETISNIAVNFGLISDQFHYSFAEGNTVQILGDLQEIQKIEEIENSFIVNAHIIRDMSKVDPALYHEASTLQSIACPRTYFTCSSSGVNEKVEDIQDSSNDGAESDYNTPRCKISKKESPDNNKHSNEREHSNIAPDTHDSSVDMFADSD